MMYITKGRQQHKHIKEQWNDTLNQENHKHFPA